MDLSLPALDVIAPGAAALKKSYKGHLTRGLAAAAVLHLIGLGVYWAATELQAAPPPPEELQLVNYTDLAPPPSLSEPPPPPDAPAPAAGAAPPPSGTPTAVPDAEADTTATLPTQDELASYGDGPLPTFGVRGGTGTAAAAPPPPPPPPPPSPEPVPEVFEVVEQMPELQGGIAGLQSRINYPEFARRAGIEGRVFVQFVVNEQGVPSDIRVVRGIGGGCDEAAVEAVRQSRFTPGLQRGRPVKVRMSIPITFRLS